LETCAECRAELEKMKSDFTANGSPREKSALQKLKKSLFRKKVVIAVVSALCAGGILFGLHAYASLHYVPVEYYAYEEVSGMTAVIGDGLYAVYTGKNHGFTNSAERKITRGGEELLILTFYVADNFYSKHSDWKYDFPQFVQPLYSQEFVIAEDAGDDSPLAQSMTRIPYAEIYYCTSGEIYGLASIGVTDEQFDAILQRDGVLLQVPDFTNYK
jgi:hypothetical protein